MRRPSPWLTAVVFALVVLLLRLPWVAFLRWELNPDESQMMAQAMKFLSDPIPWRSVDGTSSGPLNSWLPALFLLAGFRPGYILLHSLAAVLAALQVAVTVRTLQRFSARSVALPVGCIMTFACALARQHSDFTAYTSELFPLLFLVAAFDLLVRWRCDPKSENTVLPFGFGLALGCAPWCKIQTLPLAVCQALLFLIALRKRGALDRRAGLRTAGIFLAGAAIPACIILTAVGAAGATKDLWNSYVLGMAWYAGETTLAAASARAVKALTDAYLLPLSIAAAGCGLALLCAPRIRAKKRWITGASCAYFVSALFAVCRPAFLFAHYETLLAQPLTMLTAAFVASMPACWPSRGSTNRLRSAAPLVQTCGLVASALVLLCYLPMYIRDTVSAATGHTGAANTANIQIASAIRALSPAHPIRQIGIWGWTPGVYVLTGTPPATRDAIGHMVITRGPLRDYYRARFLADLKKSSPEVFIDSVSSDTFLWRPEVDRPSDVDWTEADGYESYPELRSFVDANYVVVESLSVGKRGKAVRLFLRADLAART